MHQGQSLQNTTFLWCSYYYPTLLNRTQRHREVWDCCLRAHTKVRSRSGIDTNPKPMPLGPLLGLGTFCWQDANSCDPSCDPSVLVHLGLSLSFFTFLSPWDKCVAGSLLVAEEWEMHGRNPDLTHSLEPSQSRSADPTADQSMRIHAYCCRPLTFGVVCCAA